MWVWQSIRPGSTVAAPRSMTRAPAAAWPARVAAGPVSLTRSPSTRIAWFATTVPALGSMRRPALMRTCGRGACWAVAERSSVAARIAPRAGTRQHDGRITGLRVRARANLPAARRLSSRARRGPAVYIYRSMATTAAEPKPKVSADEAREVAEAAREQEWAAPSFVRDLFLGKLRMDLIHPYPEQDPEELRRAQPFLERLERLVRETGDSDRIDREGEIPDALIQGLRELGAFGIKIPREDGGPGPSPAFHHKATGVGASVGGPPHPPLSPPPSIGVPPPPQMFCRGAPKKKKFPRPPKGGGFAFALTEPGVG